MKLFSLEMVLIFILPQSILYFVNGSEYGLSDVGYGLIYSLASWLSICIFALALTRLFIPRNERAMFYDHFLRPIKIIGYVLTEFPVSTIEWLCGVPQIVPFDSHFFDLKSKPPSRVEIEAYLNSHKEAEAKAGRKIRRWLLALCLSFVVAGIALITGMILGLPFSVNLFDWSLTVSDTILYMLTVPLVSILVCFIFFTYKKLEAQGFYCEVKLSCAPACEESVKALSWKVRKGYGADYLAGVAKEGRELTEAEARLLINYFSQGEKGTGFKSAYHRLGFQIDIS